uniref:StAR related lipid transfer domain containing 5 n=1 Tax=Poecilia reticulata TaxID=8081 RepID=A0A3P9QG38_POERE
MDYEHKAKAVADCLMSYRRDESGWKVCRKSNDVVVSWRPSSEFPGNVVLNQPCPLILFYSVCESISLSSIFVQDISICRTVTPSAAMGIIAPRDFVDVILVKQYEDGSISSNATNVIHPSCPPHPGYVRGFNHACGCICIPISGEPRKTEVSSFFQTDLGGLLPRSVVDSFFPSSMTEFYSNLAKAVKSLKDI